jgi:hypothetical protein
MVDLVQYGAIVAISGLIGDMAKASPIPDKYIPSIVGTAGGVLGVVGMYVTPDFPATDPLNAVAIGVVSGLASTGLHQVYHQLVKDKQKDGKTEEAKDEE